MQNGGRSSSDVGWETADPGGKTGGSEQKTRDAMLKTKKDLIPELSCY